jgi:hypothetical protein
MNRLHDVQNEHVCTHSYATHEGRRTGSQVPHVTPREEKVKN